eukprot:TRINITY_DN11830_c0_g1_i1.p1 TRINITY_DN11830_c0_g1~~TRINITY_DN11830_c0_g1_i1.p1  ORF type:complete len:455 (-),score=75.70 TRINITY_DN11830_c0_g1_i1:51-1415(-)
MNPGSNERIITNISQLTPYNNNATIKARVAFRSAVRTYTNQKGEGKLFHVELVDSSGEIKCTMFNDVVDKFEPLLQLDKIFYISKASIKAANRKFTKADYEMTLNSSSVIEEVFDSDDLPKIRYEFLQEIDQIQDIDLNTLVDVFGVISSCSDVSTLTSKKDGRTLLKRSLHIVDKSNRSVEMTLWGDKAENFEGKVGDVIALKNARIGEYMNAKNLSAVNSTQIDLNPQGLEGTQILAQWFAENSDSLVSDVKNISSANRSSEFAPTIASTFAEIQQAIDQNIGNGDSKPIFRKVKATITWIKHDDRAPLFYKAFPGSNAKVVENTTNNGEKAWFCQKTNQYSDTYEPRFILNMALADSTGAEFVSLFDEWAKTLLGYEAKDVEKFRQDGNESALNIVFDGPIDRRYWVKVKAVEDSYQDESRIRITVVGMEEINHAAESQRLINEIHQMMSV